MGQTLCSVLAGDLGESAVAGRQCPSSPLHHHHHHHHHHLLATGYHRVGALLDLHASPLVPRDVAALQPPPGVDAGKQDARLLPSDDPAEGTLSVSSQSCDSQSVGHHSSKDVNALPADHPAEGTQPPCGSQSSVISQVVIRRECPPAARRSPCGRDTIRQPSLASQSIIFSGTRVPADGHARLVNGPAARRTPCGTHL